MTAAFVNAAARVSSIGGRGRCDSVPQQQQQQGAAASSSAPPPQQHYQQQRHQHQHAQQPEQQQQQQQQQQQAQQQQSAARSVNVLHALSGGVAGAVAKTMTAPLARLVILYQIEAFAPAAAGAASASASTGAGASAGPLASPTASAAARGGRAAAAAGAAGAAARPPGLFDALARVVRTEGVRSLWKGNLATIAHRVPYSAINFWTYEAASRALAAALPPGSDVARRMGAGAAAGLVACTAAYPLDLVRTRLAAQTRGASYYAGIGGSLRRIVADEGAAGLYRGLGATLLQVVPSLALSFTVYETARARAAAWEAARRAAVGGGGGSSSSSSGGVAVRSSSSGGGGSGGTQSGAGGAAGEWDLAQALQQRGDGAVGSSSMGTSSSSSSNSISGSTTTAPPQQQRHSGGGLAKPLPVSPAASLACGCVSGLVTATVTFPLDVVRRRMQVEGAGRRGAAPSYGAVARAVWASAGARGFYAGLTAEYAKVVPGVAIAYGAYEAMKAATAAD